MKGTSAAARAGFVARAGFAAAAAGSVLMAFVAVASLAADAWAFDPAAPAAGGVDRRRPAPPDVADPPADARPTPSGLRTKVLTPGHGTRHPGKTDFVEVTYSAWRQSGPFFEGTGVGESARFDRREIIPGLDEGIDLMVEGETRRLWIPPALAYAARPDHVNAPRDAMTFDVTLVKIVPAPSMPPDVAAAPPTASKTRSGVRFRYLHHGRAARAGSTSWIQIRQSIWTPDGKLFSTSLRVSDVLRTPVGDLCPGAQEIVPRLREGDQVRLWLPGKLAFGDPQPGQEPSPFSPPLGPVVIDLELVKIGDR